MVSVWAVHRRIAAPPSTSGPHCLCCRGRSTAGIRRSHTARYSLHRKCKPPVLLAATISPDRRGVNFTNVCRQQFSARIIRMPPQRVCGCLAGPRGRRPGRMAGRARRSITMSADAKSGGRLGFMRKQRPAGAAVADQLPPEYQRLGEECAGNSCDADRGAVELRRNEGDAAHGDDHQ